jgi:succinoglycan biosynthesis transport protein ExoP
MTEEQSIMPFHKSALERPDVRGATFRASEAAADSFAYLRAYWQILRKRRGTVLAVAVLATVLVAIYSFKVRPVYRATARVEVEAETPALQSLTEMDRAFSEANTAFLQTQVDILKSDALALTTIQGLRLDQNADFTGAKNAAPAASEDSANGEGRLLKTFRSDLNVELMRDSRVIEVSFESTDRLLAATVANALVKGYVESNFRKKYDATRQASAWMEQQLDELKAKVEKSQQALVDYERQNNITAIDDKENVVEERLAELTKDQTDAQSARARSESIYDALKSQPSRASQVADDALLEKLEENRAAVSSQLAELSTQFGPNYPTVVKTRNQLRDVDSAIDTERTRVLARAQNEYNAALRREALLTQAVGDQKAQVAQLNQLLIQHNILKREADSNQQLYDDLLKRLKDATVSAGLQATNLHVVDEARTPSVPVRPEKLKNILIGLTVGLGLGITMAFVREGLDNSVKNTEDLEAASGVPSLAVIPLGGTAARGRYYTMLTGRYGSRPAYGAKALNKPNGNANGNGKSLAKTHRVEMAVLDAPLSEVAESFRVLRTSILLSCAPRPPKTILVASAHPSEGKTCTALNLTMALAQRGGRVVIVDADLRKPGVTRALNLMGHYGLSEILTGAFPLGEVLLPHPEVPNLWLLGSGALPPNPSELLSSRTMENLIKTLATQFDHVVIDSPPVLMVTDATLLSSMVDGVVMVCESGVTSRAAVIRVRRILDQAGARILGSVLNKLDFVNEEYYESRYRNYSYYYRGPAYRDEPPARTESVH